MIKSKFALLTLVLFFSSFCFAQETFECFVKYYLNNKNKTPDHFELYLITNKDTIKARVEKDKVLFPRITENFALELKMENTFLRLGSYRPENFYKIQAIIVGKINAVKKLKNVKSPSDMYLIDDFYPLTISHPEKIGELIYGILEKHELVDNKKSIHMSSYTKLINEKT